MESWRGNRQTHQNTETEGPVVPVPWQTPLLENGITNGKITACKNSLPPWRSEFVHCHALLGVGEWIEAPVEPNPETQAPDKFQEARRHIEEELELSCVCMILFTTLICVSLLRSLILAS